MFLKIIFTTRVRIIGRSTYLRSAIFTKQHYYETNHHRIFNGTIFNLVFH